jgi:DNA-directed RNA polymerase subunit L
MEVKKIKEEDKKLLVELERESKTFANLIREELWNDENIEEASSIKNHPYMDEPKILVKMSGRYSNTKALKDAAKRVQTKVKDLEKEFSRAFK